MDECKKEESCESQIVSQYSLIFHLIVEDIKDECIEEDYLNAFILDRYDATQHHRQLKHFVQDIIFWLNVKLFREYIMHFHVKFTQFDTKHSLSKSLRPEFHVSHIIGVTSLCCSPRDNNLELIEQLGT